MVSAGAAEAKQMTARFKNSKNFTPKRNARYIVIPFLAHEREPVRRISDNGVNRVRFKELQLFKRVAKQKGALRFNRRQRQIRRAECFVVHM